MHLEFVIGLTKMNILYIHIIYLVNIYREPHHGPSQLKYSPCRLFYCDQS